MLAAAGLPPLRRSISRGLAWTLGAACEAAYGLARLDREPPMTRFVADELSKSHWFDISAARRELGYTPTVTLEEGLRRLAGWLAGQATSQPGGST
jgi:nucleoside-diphosphate-sugar epimerase